jgi:hypothetical protein
MRHRAGRDDIVISPNPNDLAVIGNFPDPAQSLPVPVLKPVEFQIIEDVAVQNQILHAKPAEKLVQFLRLTQRAAKMNVTDQDRIILNKIVHTKNVADAACGKIADILTKGKMIRAGFTPALQN